MKVLREGVTLVCIMAAFIVSVICVEWALQLAYVGLGDLVKAVLR